ncbi:MAG: hypothetical protein LBR79_05800 [Oscillospiraceae bacterium]|nr:hypothetical protein [Oscillospiraceae bacterium]
MTHHRRPGESYKNQMLFKRNSYSKNYFSEQLYFFLFPPQTKKCTNNGVLSNDFHYILIMNQTSYFMTVAF